MDYCQYAVIDSGVGGLPYFKAIKTLVPRMTGIYIADNKNFPYGEKTAAELINAGRNIIQKIIRECTPDVIVAACNTLSVTAIDVWKDELSTPFVKTLPPIAEAEKQSPGKRIGIIGSRRTLEGSFVQREIARAPADCFFDLRPDPELIAAIENGLPFASEEEKEAAVMPAIQQFLQSRIDTLILGCTHFLHIKTVFQEAAPHIQIIDSVSSVAAAAQKILAQSPISLSTTKSCNRFFLTKNPDAKNKKKYEHYARGFNLAWGGIL